MSMIPPSNNSMENGNDENSDNDIDEGEEETKTIVETITPYLGYVLLCGCIAFWQAMGVVLQDFQQLYPQHYFTTWCVHNGFLTSLLVWLGLQVFYFETPSEEIKARLSDKRILKITASFSVLSITGTCLWYYSLENTVLSANNAIYQTV